MFNWSLKIMKNEDIVVYNNQGWEIKIPMLSNFWYQKMISSLFNNHNKFDWIYSIRYGTREHQKTFPTRN